MTSDDAARWRIVARVIAARHPVASCVAEALAAEIELALEAEHKRSYDMLVLSERQVSHGLAEQVNALRKEVDELRVAFEQLGFYRGMGGKT